jgi:predicted kinase
VPVSSALAKMTTPNRASTINAEANRLARRVARQADVSRPHFICIDGMHGVGKSSLARCIGGLLDAPVFSSDHFRIRDAESYIDQLNLRQLKSCLRIARRRGGAVIFDAVLNAEVLEALNLKADTTIYVRHNWPKGKVTHADLFDDTISREQLEDQALSLTRELGWPMSHSVALECQLIAYHKQRSPHVFADILHDSRFERNVG